MSGNVELKDLFDPEPEQWGLRGDPYVWRAMRARLDDVAVPATSDELTRLLQEAFRDVVRADLADDDIPEMVDRPEFAHGGMSSGMVSLAAWRERLLPLLEERGRRAQAGGRAGPRSG